MDTQLTASSLFTDLKSRIEARKARVGIIGLGYVGLPLALLYSEQKFPVTGFDIDQRKIDTLASGGTYIFRITPEEIAAAKSSGFKATADYSQITAMDAIIICVPTPLNEYHEPDLSYITNTAHAVAPNLRAGQIVILESTTYPGTTEEVLIPILEQENKAGLKASRKGTAGDNDIWVAFSPEREDPGNTQVARHDIPKVIGGLDPQASEIAAALYGAIFRRTVPVSSPAAAEMTKLLENIYRCVNIALVNELKMLCLRMDLDIWEIIDAAATKPFGFMPFRPGPGVGGHCIPVDPYYLSWRARQFDFVDRFVELAGDINLAMPRHVVDLVAEALNDRSRAVRGSRVAVIGVAFKPNVRDPRNSPAADVIALLRDRGAIVQYHDPHVPTFVDGGGVQATSQSLVELLAGADAVVVLTAHRAVDWKAVQERAQLIVDTVGVTRDWALAPRQVLRLGAGWVPTVGEPSLAEPGTVRAGPAATIG